MMTLNQWSLAYSHDIEPPVVRRARDENSGIGPAILTLLDLPVADLPHDFWKSIARVGVRICYASVFEEHWIVESKALGHQVTWREIASCPAQADSVDF